MAALAAGFESSLLELAHPGPRCSSAQAAALDAFVTVAVAQAAPDGELTVACRWADGVAPPPAGAACAVMSDLYSALWDAACGAGKLRLKARVVMPGDDAAAAATAAELMRAPLRAVLFDESLGLASLPTMEAIELLNGARAKQALAPVAVCPLDGAKCRAAAGVGDAAVVYLDDASLGALPTYRTVALGGTFDGLHNGHRKLLSLAALVVARGGELVVGVTGAAMLTKKKRADAIAPYADRERGVAEFLAAADPSLDARLVELADPFGPTVAEEAVDAILVSSETIPGARKINEMRAGKGWAPLDVLVSRRSESASMSSTFLREAQ